MLDNFSHTDYPDRTLYNSCHLKQIRDNLLSWFYANGRHSIPWKLTSEGFIPTAEEYLPVYPILVAEVMLQQTQLKVVIPYWQRWMKSFPTLSDSALAEESELLMLWQGLGYYSRVRRLHQSSKILFKLIGASKTADPLQWPRDLETWLILPGIGRSTAGSILSSAFNLPTPLIDGNVKRIFSRLIGLSTIQNKDLKMFWKLSEYLLDKNFPRDFNQALMDLGATICTPHNPSCNKCPWLNYCFAYYSGSTSNSPKQNKRSVVSNQVIGIGLILNQEKEILIDQRLNEDSMGGMWEFPGGKQENNESIEHTITRELREELGIKVKVGDRLMAFDHSYTHKQLHFIVYLCELVSGIPKPITSQEVRWVKIDDLHNYPFPKANSKIIASLKEYLLS